MIIATTLESCVPSSPLITISVTRPARVPHAPSYLSLWRAAASAAAVADGETTGPPQ